MNGSILDSAGHSPGESATITAAGSLDKAQRIKAVEQPCGGIKGKEWRLWRSLKAGTPGRKR